MKDLSCLPGCSRKTPTQRRGETRVAAMLEGAIAEFAAKGYEAATMSSIAQRAKSPIGSVYQFFPNKESLARAVRTRQIMDAERIWMRLNERTPAGDIRSFIDEFVARMIEFIKDHPAFLPLLDAPSSTLPIGPRNHLHARMAMVLKALHPATSVNDADRIAEVVLHINKSMMGLYAGAPPAFRTRIAMEYREVLGSYLERRLDRLATRSSLRGPAKAIPAARPQRAASTSKKRANTRKV